MIVTATIVALCWAVFVIYWVISAGDVKRTVERRGDWLRLGVIAAAVIGAVLLHTPYGLAIDPLVLPRTLPLGVAADALAIGGIAVLVWARTVLGRNWSGAVTLKEDHELIQRGPYAYVRHPIYSGLSLLGLATAIHYATLGGFVVLAVCCVGFAMKMREEEILMVEHFSDRYADYRARVKAVVPYLL